MVWQNSLSIYRNIFNAFWKKSLKKVDERFRKNPILLPFYHLWFDKYGNLATNESLRRYWSQVGFSFNLLGIPNVLSPVIYQPDFRFLNPFNFLFRYDNNHLIVTIRKYWKDQGYPLKTKEGEPRLLIIAVDVQDATTVTFDSYIKKGNHCMSVYGHKDDKLKHIIHYPDGIKMQHLLTAIFSHLRYKFPELTVMTIEVKDNGIPNHIAYSRQFIDGFYLSNTH